MALERQDFVYNLLWTDQADVDEGRQDVVEKGLIADDGIFVGTEVAEAGGKKIVHPMPASSRVEGNQNEVSPGLLGKWV